MFDYVFLKGEGSKGISYKPTWKPDWRMPPGFKGTSVILQVVAVSVLCAIPVYGLPVLYPPTEEQKQKKDAHAVQKQQAREQRMRWINSDEMPR